MAGIQLSGLASGMDWKTTVDQLMQIEQVPQDTLKKKQALITRTQSAYDTLNTNLTSLKNAAFALQTGLSGFPRAASVTAGDTSTSASDAVVTTSSGAAIGDYTLKVNSLGTASTLAGLGLAARPKRDAALLLKLKDDYGVTPGTVTINGQKYTITQSYLDGGATIGDLFGISGGAYVQTDKFAGSTLTLPGSSLFKAEITTEGTLKLSAGNSSGAGGYSVGASGDTSNLMAALGLSFNSDLSKTSGAQTVTATGTVTGTGSATYTQTMPTAALGKVLLGNLSGGASFSSSSKLTINGIDVGPTSGFTSLSTLGEVISAINSTPATGVTASVDATSGSLVLTASSLGRSVISVGETGSGLLGVLGLVKTTDAGYSTQFKSGAGMSYEFKANGVSVDSAGTSDTSTVDLSKYGYGPTQVAVSNIGTFNVRVSSSGADYKAKINTLISSYNDLKQTLDDSTKITVGSDGKVSASIFSNRADINNLLSTIKNKIYSQVTDSTGSTINSSYNTAGKIGLGFDSNGKMQITDSTKLDSALANNPSFVDALFNLNKSATGTLSSENQGIATRIYNLTNSMVSTGGMVLTAKASLTTQNTRLQSQIDSMTRTLAQQRASLERSFIAMEQAQSRYQSMTSQLTNAFK